MPSRLEPEVITLSDGEEQESQDLFESPVDEKKCRSYDGDSEDLFSSPEQSKDGSVLGRNDGNSFSLSPESSVRNGMKPGNGNGTTRRSLSVTVSPRKSLTPSLVWRRKNSNHSPKSPLSHPLLRKPTPKKAHVRASPEAKSKCDMWTKARLDKFSKKFEERSKIMADLVQNDQDFFDVVNGGVLEQVQKEAKERLVEGAVIRNKADRARMKGVTCASSKAYFDALELSPQSKERRINEISRVRVVAQKMPSTPENYWEIGFPSESEQRRRGLIKEVRKKAGRKLFPTDGVSSSW